MRCEKKRYILFFKKDGCTWGKEEVYSGDVLKRKCVKCGRIQYNRPFLFETWTGEPVWRWVEEEDFFKCYVRKEETK